MSAPSGGLTEALRMYEMTHYERNLNWSRECLIYVCWLEWLEAKQNKVRGVRSHGSASPRTAMDLMCGTSSLVLESGRRSMSRLSFVLHRAEPLIAVANVRSGSQSLVSQSGWTDSRPLNCVHPAMPNANLAQIFAILLGQLFG